MHDQEAEHSETVELADYLRVIRERWWVIIAAVVIVLAASVVVSLIQTPQYRASARLLYQDNNFDQALFGSQLFSSSSQDREVLTAAALVKLEPVAEAVKETLGTDMTSTSLLGMVTVDSESSTNIITIDAVSADPDQAATVANAFAEQFIAFRQSTNRATVAAAREMVKEQLDTLSEADAESAYGLMLKEKYESLRILESMENGGFTLVEQATPPLSPFSPQSVRNAILAVIIGLVLGLGLAFLLEYLDRRIKDERTLEKIIGAPVLAGIPAVGGRWKGSDRASAPVGFNTHPELLEPFRTLRSSLQYFDVDRGVHKLLITSGLPAEGKTITTVNLALSLALSGKRVIVVEADLRRPIVHEYLDLDARAGLSSVLAGTTRVADAIQLVKADRFVPEHNRRKPTDSERSGLLQQNLYVLTSGPLPPNPAELLASERMAKLLEELSGMADYLLIDTPPILLVSDAVTLTPHVDGVIYTALMNSTSRDNTEHARSILDRAGARIIGVVAGNLRRGGTRYGYKSRYGYGYSYGYGTDKDYGRDKNADRSPQRTTGVRIIERADHNPVETPRTESD